MASWMNNLRNFGRQGNPPRPSGPNQPPSRSNTSSPSQFGNVPPPNIPPSPAPSLSATMASSDRQPRANPPFFFREDYSGFFVKGNFMTITSKPVWVELGEWIAHQMVEQNRLLNGMISILSAEDRNIGMPVCNATCCPTMSAGSITYTWIDTNRQSINLPAPVYIKHIQTWINGKIGNENLFPTQVHSVPPAMPTLAEIKADAQLWIGKSSGFPKNFDADTKNMYKQMMRCYAHLFFGHWLDFWHMDVYKYLNTAFMHYVSVGRSFGLLTDKDLEPMKPLVDIWVARGDLPKMVTDDGVPAPAGSTTISSNGEVVTAPSSNAQAIESAPAAAPATDTAPAAPGAAS